MTKIKKINRIVTCKLFAGALMLCISINGFSFNSQAQQQFIHVAGKSNNSCNGDCTLLDVPELNNNPSAIIFVTPILSKGINLNPHPIGVYYFKNQWLIFNLDQRAIPVNARFSVEYFTSPDPNHFQYSITQEDLQKDGAAFIDHPALNKKPNAQFRLFTSWNPEEKGGKANRDSITMQYNEDAGKWSVRNSNGKPLFARVTYNINVSSAGNTNPVITNTVQINELIIAPTSNSLSTLLNSMWMTVWADGIKLPGDKTRSTAAYLDKTQIADFLMGASSLSPSGQLSTIGKKTYDPITIRIPTGYPPTTPLFNAYVKSQNMEFTIEAFSYGTAGNEELNYSIKLSGARIVSFKQTREESGLTNPASAKKFLDEIKIIFTKIEFIKDGTSVVDNL